MVATAWATAGGDHAGLGLPTARCSPPSRAPVTVLRETTAWLLRTPLLRPMTVPQRASLSDQALSYSLLGLPTAVHQHRLSDLSGSELGSSQACPPCLAPSPGPKALLDWKSCLDDAIFSAMHTKRKQKPGLATLGCIQEEPFPFGV